MESVFGSVPFLNGGLFEETDLDRRPGVTVPDGAVERVLRGLFDRFNFTVMESTPFDIEVAVDPEMLGKVFEELVTGRHESGAYYTPRPVVSFMCREALKGFLEGRDVGLPPEAVARFVDEHDASGIPLASAPKVGAALDEATIVDPACGSGAYLLGMMQELVELQTALYNVRADDRSLYDLKLHIIQRNLYGVDNDEFAVNIAMLRMWLSLAIEYEGERPEPLPNLDFKVVRGDSLLGPDPSAGVEVQGDAGPGRRADSAAARAAQGEYMRASTGPEKERLRGPSESCPGAGQERVGRTLPCPKTWWTGACSSPRCSTAAGSTSPLPTRRMCSCRQTEESWGGSTRAPASQPSPAPATSTSSSTSGAAICSGPPGACWPTSPPTAG